MQKNGFCFECYRVFLPGFCDIYITHARNVKKNICYIFVAIPIDIRMGQLFALKFKMVRVIRLS